MRKSFTHPNKLWKSFTLRRMRSKALNWFCSEHLLVESSPPHEWQAVGSSLPPKMQTSSSGPECQELGWGGGLETPSRQPLLSLQGRLRPRQGSALNGAGGTLPICHRTGHLPRSSLRPPQHPPFPPSHEAVVMGCGRSLSPPQHYHGHSKPVGTIPSLLP